MATNDQAFPRASGPWERGTPGMTYYDWLVGKIAGGAGGAIAQGIAYPEDAAAKVLAFADVLCLKLEYRRQKEEAEQSELHKGLDEVLQGLRDVGQGRLYGELTEEEAEERMSQLADRMEELARRQKEQQGGQR